MARNDGIVISAEDVRVSGPFGAWFDTEKLRREDGTQPTLIVVMTSEPGGFRPHTVLLPHQFYLKNARALLKETGARRIWLLPVYDTASITEVRLPQEPIGE